MLIFTYISPFGKCNYLIETAYYQYSVTECEEMCFHVCELVGTRIGMPLTDGIFHFRQGFVNNAKWHRPVNKKQTFCLEKVSTKWWLQTLNVDILSGENARVRHCDVNTTDGVNAENMGIGWRCE